MDQYQLLSQTQISVSILWNGDPEGAIRPRLCMTFSFRALSSGDFPNKVVS